MSRGSESYSVANSSWGAAQCRTYRMQWEAVTEVSEASKVIVWVWMCLCVHVNWGWVWYSNHTYWLLSYQWGWGGGGYPANQARIISYCRKLWVYCTVRFPTNTWPVTTVQVGTKDLSTACIASLASCIPRLAQNIRTGSVTHANISPISISWEQLH